MAEHPDDDYAGPATITVGDATLEVRVRLLAHTEPLDGRLHWFGRVEQLDGLARLLRGGAADVQVATSGGRAAGRIGDVDLWGRYRLTGVGNPPFALDGPPTG